MHSVVVPLFNEAEGIAAFHERCMRAMRSIGEAFELVYVDDGSLDGSWTALLDLHRRNPQEVRLVRLSRNFGHQVAISAGLEGAAGETVTVIDSDLQDPPEVIGQLIERWRAGADIVYAVRSRRKGETWFKRASASLYYRTLRLLADVDLPLDAGDFRLMSRRAVDALLRMPERHRYVRGLVAWIGFTTDSVRYEREPRAVGETKYPLKKMVVFAIDGVASFSVRPLRAAVWLGLLVSVAAFALAVVLMWLRLAGDVTVEGWTSLVVIVLLMSGVQLLTIGMLGEYVGRMYAEVQGRPLYLVQERIGFEVGSASSSPVPDDTRERVEETA